MKFKKIIKEANWKEPDTTYYFNKDCFVRHPDDEISHNGSKKLRHPEYTFKKGSTWSIVWRDTDLETQFIALSDGKVERFVLGEDLDYCIEIGACIKTVDDEEDILRFADENV